MQRRQAGMAAQNITRTALLAAAALALGWIESFIPTPPGIKLGLANTVLLYALYLMDVKHAVLLMILKVFLSGLTYAGINAMFYSLGGSVVSLGMMVLVKKLCRDRISVVAVSAVGAVFHNVGQLLVVCIIAGWRPALVLSPALLLAGVVMGVVTGIVGQYAIGALARVGPSHGKGGPREEKRDDGPGEGRK